MHYLDTSVLLSLLVADSHTADAQRFVLDARHAPFAVSGWAEVEVEGILNRASRDGRFTPAQITAVRRGLLQLRRHPQVRRPPIGESAFDTAATFLRGDAPLYGPDALHVGFASTLDATLVTADRQQHAAARAHAVPSVYLA